MNDRISKAKRMITMATAMLLFCCWVSPIAKAQKSMRKLPSGYPTQTNPHAQAGAAKRIASLPKREQEIQDRQELTRDEKNQTESMALSAPSNQESATQQGETESLSSVFDSTALSTIESNNSSSAPIFEAPLSSTTNANLSFQQTLNGFPHDRGTGQVQSSSNEFTYGNQPVNPGFHYQGQFHANGRLPYAPVLDHSEATFRHERESMNNIGRPATHVQDWSTERERFWNQFSTTPPEGGRDARTEGYESFGAIIANGFAYGRIEFAVLEPHFQNNGGLNITAGPLTINEPFDFGFEFTPRYVFGFETNAGPGIELNHWQFNEFSDGLMFQGDGFSNGAISVFAGGTGATRALATSGNQSIDSRHHLKIQSTGINFFKAVKAPVSRIRGSLGMRYIASQHDLIANRSDGASLFNNSNFQGGGPTIGIDYFRPLGHTQINLLGGFGLALMFGHHSQTVTESGVMTFRETATDHQMTVFDMHLGAEWKRKISRCNSVLIRGVIESQHWLNGGSAVDPDSDFGLYGFVFSAGVTR